MDWKLFLILYVLYIAALFVGYRYLIKYIEKRKLKKKLAQEQKLNSESQLKGEKNV